MNLPFLLSNQNNNYKNYNYLPKARIKSTIYLTLARTMKLIIFNRMLVF